MIRVLSLFALTLLLAACQQSAPSADDLPTRAPSGEAVATAAALTAIAPPEGIREQVAFPQVDANLVFLDAWYLDASIRFDGIFTRTPREISASTGLQIWYNQNGNERRVIIEGEGELFGEQDTVTREGVRLGSETFLLIDGLCLGDADGDAATIADLRVSDVMGGVSFATPAGEQRVINGIDVWRYEFDPVNMVLPLVQLGETGVITNVNSELWVGQIPPGENVVIRYNVNMEVDDVVLRLFEDSLPVSGQLVLRYDLRNIGVNPNITQPFGC